jgi:competence protein ComEA
LARKSTKAIVALVFVGGLMAFGAGPPPSLAIGHAIATAATTVASAPLQAAVAPTGASASPASEPAARAPPDGTVCINDANPEALRRLPGVGEKRAKAIVELRTRLGKLKRPEDLLRVKGLGRKRLAKIRPLLRFACEPPASPASDASAPQ